MKHITIITLSIFLISNLCGMETGLAIDSSHDSNVEEYWQEVGKKWERDLKYAIREQQLDKLKGLLEDQSLCETFPAALNRAFVFASWQNSEDVNIKMMTMFLKIPDVLINYDDQVYGGATALINAVLEGHLKSIQFLLKQPGIDVNTRISEKTALEWITNSKSNISNRQEIINLLINAQKPHRS